MAIHPWYQISTSNALCALRDIQICFIELTKRRASALGLRPSTLRYWDAEGLVVPDRRSPGGARRYWPEQVGDAPIVHQLRTIGQRTDSVRELMPALRAGLRGPDLAAAFAARPESITRRSRALLDAAAALRLVLPFDDVALPLA